MECVINLDDIETVVVLCWAYTISFLTHCTKLLKIKQNSTLTANEKTEINNFLDVIEEVHKRLNLSKDMRCKIRIRFYNIVNDSNVSIRLT